MKNSIVITSVNHARSMCVIDVWPIHMQSNAAVIHEDSGSTSAILMLHSKVKEKRSEHYSIITGSPYIPWLQTTAGPSVGWLSPQETPTT